jgi:hypothetical protein
MGRTSPFRGEGGKVWNRDAKAASGPAAAFHPFSCSCDPAPPGRSCRAEPAGLPLPSLALKKPGQRAATVGRWRRTRWMMI